MKMPDSKYNPYISVVIIFSLIAALSVGIVKAATGNNEKDDIKERALAAYNAYLSQDEIVWDQYNDDWIDYARTSKLEYSIVSLSRNTPPVLFLKNKWPLGATSGMTRLGVYNEKTGQPDFILGDGWNCRYVLGYIPKSINNPHPIIYAGGGRQDVISEYFFELLNDNSVRELGIADFVNPELANGEDPIVRARYSTDNDTYEWDGISVTKEQYYAERDALLPLVKRIEWQPNSQGAG